MKTKQRTSGLSRRDFLVNSAAGAGIVMAPSFLLGCGGAAQHAGGSPSPDDASVATIGHFGSFGINEALMKKTLTEAMARGGDFADLFFQHKVENYVGLQDGEVNRAYSRIDLGCGVRVVKGDQTGFAYTQDLSSEALANAARTAAVVANESKTSPPEKFANVAHGSFYEIETPWSDVGIDQKIPLLSHANTFAMNADKRIIKVQVFMADTTSHVLVARSDGQILEDFQPMTEVWLTCVAEKDGKRETNYNSIGERRGFELYSEAKMEEIAKTAVDRTTVLFDAVEAQAGEFPVVLAPGLSGILLHEAIGHGMEADFNRKGISVYTDRIGKRIAPEFVTIVDDGTNPNERGSINIDDEGNPAKRTVLVENGILASYMHDRISADHFKLEPTGNGRRENYRYPPVPRMRNTYMVNGPHSPEEIVKSVKRGIYAENFGNGQVDIGAGDFAFYLKNGYLIEDGKITAPVKDVNLIGFGPKVLEEIEMVGNDMTLYSGSGNCGKDGQRVPVGFGLPTIKCRAISVGGKK